jgi:LysM repeat protein
MSKTKILAQNKSKAMKKTPKKNHKNINMDSVKIKRVKRNKKKPTTASKIMAGVGVGSTLLGGIGAVSPQTQTNEFVSESTSSNSKSSGIKEKLAKIFGATFGPKVALADEHTAGEAGMTSEGRSGHYVDQGDGTLALVEDAGHRVLNPNGSYYLSDGQGGWELAEDQGAGVDTTVTTGVGVDVNTPPNPNVNTYNTNTGSPTTITGTTTVNTESTEPEEGDTRQGYDGTETYKNGQWVLNAGVRVQNSNGFYYNSDGQGGWVLANGQTKTENGTTYISNGGQWEAQTLNEGATKTENGFKYTYYQGSWILDNGQVKTENGINYTSLDGSWQLNDGQTKVDGGFNYSSINHAWYLVDGQTKTEGSVIYVSSGGQWVVKTVDTNTTAHQEGDSAGVIDGDSTRPAVWHNASGSTQSPNWVIVDKNGNEVKNGDGFMYIADGSNGWNLKSGQHKTENGKKYTSNNGQWVEDPAETVSDGYKAGDRVKNGNGFYYVSDGNGNWAIDDITATPTPNSAYKYHANDNHTQWILDDGQTDEANQPGKITKDGVWINNPTGSVVTPGSLGAINPTNVALENINGLDVRVVSLNVASGTLNLNGSSYILGQAVRLEVVPGGGIYFNGVDVTSQLSAADVTRLHALDTYTPTVTPTVVYPTTVRGDINNSKTGTIVVNGQNVVVTVIPGGYVFDENGNDITSQLVAQGVNIVALTTAFNSAQVTTAGSVVVIPNAPAFVNFTVNTAPITAATTAATLTSAYSAQVSALDAWKASETSKINQWHTSNTLVTGMSAEQSSAVVATLQERLAAIESNYNSAKNSINAAKDARATQLNIVVTGTTGAPVVTRTATGGYTITMGNLTFTGATAKDVEAQLQNAYSSYLGYSNGTVKMDLNTYNAFAASLASAVSGVTVNPATGSLGAYYEQGDVRVYRNPDGTYKIEILTNEPVLNPQTGQRGYNLILTGTSTSSLVTLINQALKNVSGDTTLLLQNAISDISLFNNQEKTGQLRFTFQTNPNLNNPNGTGNTAQNAFQFATKETADSVAAMLKAAGLSGVVVTSQPVGNLTQYYISFEGTTYQGNAGLIANLIQTGGIDSAVNLIKTELAEGKGDYKTLYVGVGTGGVVGSVNNYKAAPVGAPIIPVFGSQPTTTTTTTTNTSTQTLPAGFLIPPGGFPAGTVLPNGLSVSPDGKTIIDSTGKVVGPNGTATTTTTTTTTASAAPTVSSISVSHAEPGALVTVIGSGFNTSAGSKNAIQFIDSQGNFVKNISASEVNSTGTQVKFTVPNLPAGAYKIVITNSENAKSAAPVNFTVDAKTGTQTTSSVSLSLSKNTLSLAVGAIGTISSSVITGSGINYRVTATTASDKILVNVNATTGVINIIGLAPGTATIKVHPTDLAATDTSQDQIITVTIVALTSTSGGGVDDETTDSNLTGQITTNAIAVGTVGAQYQQALTTTLNNVSWSIISSAKLPPGLTLNSSTGVISGVPTLAGNYTVVIAAVSGNQSAIRLFNFTINPAGTTTSTTTTTTNTGGNTTTTNVDNAQITALQNQIVTLQNQLGQLSNNPNQSAQITALQNQINTLTSLLANTNRTGTVTTSVIGGGTNGLQFTNLASGLEPGYTPEGVANVNRATGLAMPAGYRASGAQIADIGGAPFGVYGTSLQTQSASQVEGASTASTTYVVKKGDTLWNIAKKYYGDGKQWRKIMAENSDKVKNPKTLKIGTVLVIPGVNK